MKRIVLLSILWLIAAFSPAQDRLSEAEINAMEERIKTVTDPAARLFFQANIYRAKGELERAHKTLAELIVKYDHDKRWVARSELLSARFYLDMGMLDAADVTARQVEFLNKGTAEAEEARRLRLRIKQMKEQSEKSKENGVSG